MANLTILRTYALKNVTELPTSVLFSHSDKAMTIYDAYPKSIFHFLVLPRVVSPPPSKKENQSTGEDPGVKSSTSQTVATTESAPASPSSPSVADLSSLRTLLNSRNVSKEQAKEVIVSLKDEALRVKAEIEQEMEKRYGFVWDVWIGFHASPSQEHVHLHVLSGDLCSERMKKKKHYNSFRPKLGFFLHVHEVLSWFDAEPSYYKDITRLSSSKYEALLKEPLSCFHCNSIEKNMPTLKAHLQKEWEKLRVRAENTKKRKLDLSDKALRQPSSNPANTTEEGDASPAHKKPKTDSS
ncbi:hypothetical protein P691DRAFT_801536 [Macrolepiota fuliginosa MF-IS2]|uniref:Aprataxin C2HE/C2H2/C2HC zinc finger domain-containing protein n=1 Tax=Macrolepiota fuliginosa MF-IS2 TaxID=1400762 RepID=A0A9P5XLZ9_9AGAR|nr:hypothetical protein P691DRAFT_801536 [Macrolepiota fuliginosa MF-IS2]